jgi:hypothetical protein
MSIYSDASLMLFLPIGKSSILKDSVVT